MPPPTRSTFGKYVLLRKLASGGMGEIFLAKQRGPSGFEKLLVIKRILSHHLDKKDYLDMFFSEAKLVARLNHNNIIQIQEMGEIDGDHYIAMEYVRGKSLRDLIDELRSEGRMLQLSHVVELAIKLCEGLGYAHQARDIRGHPMNIVHRDINPHNILIAYTGDLKLIDFGIAKSEMTSVHTATGTIKGKFVYMSPEQSAADPIDRRSDIFSLGIVLYEMLCLENPFVRQNVVLSLEAIQRHPVAVPSSKRPDGGPLDKILQRALEKNPEERYQTAIEMRDDLRSLFRSGEVPQAEEDLSTYLHGLFSADIDEEDRLLAEADQATSPPSAATLPAPSAVPAAASDRAQAQSVDAVPFSDEEPTLAGDLEGIRALSKAQASGEFAVEQEPSGPVMTLIPPEEVVPGTGESFFPKGPTRSDRIPQRSPTPAQPDSGNIPGVISPGLQASLAPHPDPEATGALVHRNTHLAMEASPFDEPTAVPPDPLEPTKELVGGSTVPAPRGTPSTPAPRYITDEDSEILKTPNSSFRRLLRIAGYALVLAITSAGAFVATRVMLGSRETPEEAIAPIDDETIVEDTDDTEDAPPVVRPTQPPDEPIEDVEVAVDRVRGRKATKRKKRRDGKRRKKKGARKKRTKTARTKTSRDPPPPKLVAPPPPKIVAPPPPVVVAPPKKVVTPPPKVVTPPPESDPPKAVAEVRGTLSLRTSVGARVLAGGRGVGSSPKNIRIKRESGMIKLTSIQGLDYDVTARFTVKADGLEVKVDASSWAIVKHNGLSLGKTPQGPVKAGRRHRFSFLRPGQSEPFILSILWKPKNP